MKVALIMFVCVHAVTAFFDIQDLASEFLEKLPKDFSAAMKDIVGRLPTKSVIVVRGNTTRIRSEDLFQLIHTLNENNIQIMNLEMSTNESKSRYYDVLKKALDNSEESSSLILCEPAECESILSELTESNLIHRTLLYMFYWPHGSVTEAFLATMKEAMRVAVLTNPRESVYVTLLQELLCAYEVWYKLTLISRFRIYYNQATPDRLNYLSLVNWWSGKLYKNPVLPPVNQVYRNFRGRIFDVPVLHAPPWHFVRFNNDSTITVTGGRDDKLLAVISRKLNFRYKYYDPPDRSQGSSISGNGTFKGTLGLLWKRRADFFLGDVTMTWERLQAVEFSFMTLADSGAFLTHAPDKLSETLAIVRPFHWQVWPFVCATIAITGPALWLVVSAPARWRRRGVPPRATLPNCCWFTTSLFLRQSSSKEPSSTHAARLVSVVISLGATYVIGDMYSANLTSLLARPAREQPIGTLQALEDAMRDRGYELVVERHSSSLAILENGTGVYGRLARLQRRQRIQRVRNIEVGVRMVLARKRVAVLGGRETLYYDTERFGSHNFQLSEKLYTKYSAVALQIGCPFLETFNEVLMTLFEAGILSKMTTDEYRKLPEHTRRSAPVIDLETEGVEPGDAAPSKQVNSSKNLQPVTLRMLMGAFCLLGIGHLTAAICLIVEIHMYKRRCKQLDAVRSFQHIKSNKMKFLSITYKRIRRRIRRAIRATRRHYDEVLTGN